MIAVVEDQLRCGKLSRLRPFDNRLPQGVAQSVEVGFAGPARQLVEAEWNDPVVGPSRLRLQAEGRHIEELCAAVQLMPGEAHEQLFEPVEVDFGVLITNLELFADLIVEILKQL